MLEVMKRLDHSYGGLPKVIEKQLDKPVGVKSREKYRRRWSERTESAARPSRPAISRRLPTGIGFPAQAKEAQQVFSGNSRHFGRNEGASIATTLRECRYALGGEIGLARSDA
jgi:hypothetical protein